MELFCKKGALQRDERSRRGKEGNQGQDCISVERWMMWARRGRLRIIAHALADLGNLYPESGNKCSGRD